MSVTLTWSPLHGMLWKPSQCRKLSSIFFEDSLLGSKHFYRRSLPRHLNSNPAGHCNTSIDYRPGDENFSTITRAYDGPNFAKRSLPVPKTLLKVRSKRLRDNEGRADRMRKRKDYTRAKDCALLYTSCTLSRSCQSNRPQSRFLSIYSICRNKEDSFSGKPGTHVNRHSHEHSHNDSHGHESGGLGAVFHHSHSHASTPETKELLLGDKKDPKVAITRLGLAVNIGMVLTKGIGGLVFHSASLTADAIHAVSDLISDFVTLGTVSWSSRKPSLRFPYGYGKVETLGSLVVSGLLLTGGLSIGWDGLQLLYSLGYEYYFHHSHEAASYLAQEIANRTTDGALAASTTTTPPTSVGGLHHHHHHHLGEEIPSLNAAYLALVSIIVKEYLFRATRKVAENTRSTVLMANAWHHRTDSLTAMVAVVAITGGHFWQATWLDPLGGVLVSLLIIRAACSSGYNTLLELMDASQPEASEHAREATVQAITQLAKSIDAKQVLDDPILETRRKVLSHLLVKDAIAIKSGPNYNINVTLQLKDLEDGKVEDAKVDKNHANLEHDTVPSIYEAIEIASKVCRNIEHQVEQSMPGAKNVEVRILDTRP